jgi:hypothetical protein
VQVRINPALFCILERGGITIKFLIIMTSAGCMWERWLVRRLPTADQGHPSLRTTVVHKCIRLKWLGLLIKLLSKGKSWKQLCMFPLR